MKKIFIPLIIGLSAMVLLTGCIGLQIGGGDKHEVQNATVGQQLIDLKKAKDKGVITDAEYEAQKAKLLGNK
jgi:hypothetical protein